MVSVQRGYNTDREVGRDYKSINIFFMDDIKLRSRDEITEQAREAFEAQDEARKAELMFEVLLDIRDLAERTARALVNKE